MFRPNVGRLFDGTRSARHETERRELRQSFFNLRRQQSAATHQLGEEECATFCQRIEQSSARDREVHGRIRSGQDQPILQVLSLVKRDRAGS